MANIDAEYLWAYIKNTLLDFMDRYIPCKKTSKRLHLPRITSQAYQKTRYCIQILQEIKVH